MDAAVDDRTLRLVRVFDAPRERVYAAWTDPEQFAQWFGPQGVSTVYCDLDVRAGGAWRLLGQGAERRYAVSGKYLEVTPPERLVSTESWDGWSEISQKRVTSLVTVSMNHSTLKTKKPSRRRTVNLTGDSQWFHQ